MSLLSQYSDKYHNIKFERRDGVLQITLHTGGGALKWGATADSIHGQLPDAFYDVGRDEENRVVILTGAGDAFCTEFDMSQLPAPGPDFTANVAPRLFKEGCSMLMNLLDISVPVIGAVNGPALIHAELLALSDIVLAAEHASFADIAHFLHGVVPGDGVHVVWPELLGPNRGRHFLLTGERISATEAHRLGVVAEVLPAARLLPRAWELASSIAQKPTRTLRYTRVAFTQHWRKRMLEELGYGFMLEMGAA